MLRAWKNGKAAQQLQTAALFLQQKQQLEAWSTDYMFRLADRHTHFQHMQRQKEMSIILFPTPPNLD